MIEAGGSVGYHSSGSGGRGASTGAGSGPGGARAGLRAGGGSPGRAGERRGGGGGESGEQVSGRSPSGPGAGAGPAARPEAACARAWSGAGLPPPCARASPPEGAGTGGRGRDPAGAGVEPRPPAGRADPRSLPPLGFGPCAFQNPTFSKVCAQVHVIIVSLALTPDGDRSSRSFHRSRLFMFSLLFAKSTG